MYRDLIAKNGLPPGAPTPPILCAVRFLVVSPMFYH